MPLGASITFGSADEEDHHVYQTLFADHHEGMGVVVNPCSVLTMRIEKGEFP